MLFCPNAHPTSSKYDKNLHVVSEEAFSANCTCLQTFEFKLYDIKHSLFFVSRWSWCLDGRLHLCRARMAMEVLVPNVLSAPGAQSSRQYRSHWLTTNEIPEAKENMGEKWRRYMKIYENIDKLHV